MPCSNWFSAAALNGTESSLEALLSQFLYTIKNPSTGNFSSFDLSSGLVKKNSGVSNWLFCCFFLLAGDGQRWEELLSRHTQTDQEENQWVQTLPPRALWRLHQLFIYSTADGPVEGLSALFEMRRASFSRDCQRCRQDFQTVTEIQCAGSRIIKRGDVQEYREMSTASLEQFSLAAVLPEFIIFCFVSGIISWFCCRFWYKCQTWLSDIYLYIQYISVSNSHGKCYVSFKNVKAHLAGGALSSLFHMHSGEWESFC